MKNIPHKIFLQIGEDCPNDADFNMLQEVTFSKGKINHNDIEYVNTEHSPLLAFFKPMSFKTKEELNNKFNELKLNLFDGASELQRLIKEDEKVIEWDREKEEKVMYLNKSIDFFLAKLEEME